MLRLTFFALLTLFFALPRPVYAEVMLDTEPGVGYYDHYSRQLEYTRENVKFREALEERSRNYGSAGHDAMEQYRKGLKAHYDSIQSPQPEPGNELPDDFIGPPAPDGSGPNP